MVIFLIICLWARWLYITVLIMRLDSRNRLYFVNCMAGNITLEERNTAAFIIDNFISILLEKSRQTLLMYIT